MRVSAKRMLLVVLSIIIIVGIIYAIFYRAKPQAQSAKPDIQAVSVSALSYHVIPKTVMSYGQTVSPISAVVKAQTDGLIVSLDFTPGQAVKKGQLLLTLNSSDSALQLKKLAAQMQLSEQIYLRNKRLSELSPGNVSTVDVLTAKLQYEQDLAQYQQAQAMYHVSSPIDGVVTDTAVAVGDYVNATDTLVTVVAPHSLQVLYQLPSRYASSVKIGQAVLFKPSSAAQSYSAKVVYIAPLIDDNAAGIILRADFTNATGLLINRFGRVTEVLDEHYKTLAVPQTLVQSDAQGFYVYLFKDHKVFKQYFDAGEVTASGFIEVRSGLEPKEILITSDPHILKEGQVVKAAQP